MTTKPFSEAIRIFDAGNAEALAGALFRESFNAPFPVPREGCGLPIPTPPHAWRQYVAVYTWPDGAEETVGFCNFIRYGEVYLEGGMCVKKGFYKRMPRDHFRDCKARGGIAQMTMLAAEAELNDCAAWFGYCGDSMALAVDLRAGYEPTSRTYLIAKWFQDVSPAKREELVEAVARIGPF
jgi:hypothetical protein